MLLKQRDRKRETKRIPTMHRRRIALEIIIIDSFVIVIGAVIVEEVVSVLLLFSILLRALLVDSVS